MNIENIIRIITGIKPGTFTRLTYITELPLKAEFKKQGYKIFKTNAITTRFNIHYGNIKEVKEKLSDVPYTMNEALEWIVKNTIQYNKNTNSYYLCTYPTKKGRNPHSVYTVYTPSGGVYEISEPNKNWVIDSYWNKKATQMMKINVNNILKIGKY